MWYTGQERNGGLRMEANDDSELCLETEDHVNDKQGAGQTGPALTGES